MGREGWHARLPFRFVKPTLTSIPPLPRTTYLPSTTPVKSWVNSFYWNIIPWFFVDGLAIDPMVYGFPGEYVMWWEMFFHQFPCIYYPASPKYKPYTLYLFFLIVKYKFSRSFCSFDFATLAHCILLSLILILLITFGWYV